MHIGIDFDNTIVSYDEVFHRVALEQGIVPATIDRTKLAVRNWLRKSGKEDIWTEMQGYVYGTRMADAEAYPGVIEFFRWARSGGISLSIISHKTKQPFLGPCYDLHEAAKQWIETVLIDEAGPLVELDSVYFETTKDNKWARIASTTSTHFIDDLPEILFAEAFPARVKRILFDPRHHHGPYGDDAVIVQSWTEILGYFAKS